MRDYKFRGIRLDNGEWAYGSYIKKIWDISTADCRYTGEEQYLHFIWVSGEEKPMIQVDPQTVGQFTGLVDTNGVEVFEGDILQESNGLNVEMEWTFSCGCCETIHGFPDCLYQKVVGNIHDNPELLERERNEKNI